MERCVLGCAAKNCTFAFFAPPVLRLPILFFFFLSGLAIGCPFFIFALSLDRLQKTVKFVRKFIDQRVERKKLVWMEVANLVRLWFCYRVVVKISSRTLLLTDSENKTNWYSNQKKNFILILVSKIWPKKVIFAYFRTFWWPFWKAPSIWNLRNFCKICYIMLLLTDSP